MWSAVALWYKNPVPRRLETRLFPCNCWSYVFLLLRIICSNVLPNFNQIIFLLLSCLTFLCILDTSPLFRCMIFIHTLSVRKLPLPSDNCSTGCAELFSLMHFICLHFLSFPTFSTHTDVVELPPMYSSSSFMFFFVIWNTLIHF